MMLLCVNSMLLWGDICVFVGSCICGDLSSICGDVSVGTCICGDMHFVGICIYGDLYLWRRVFVRDVSLWGRVFMRTWVLMGTGVGVAASRWLGVPGFMLISSLIRGPLRKPRLLSHRASSICAIVC